MLPRKPTRATYPISNITHLGVGSGVSRPRFFDVYQTCGHHHRVISFNSGAKTASFPNAACWKLARDF